MPKVTGIPKAQAAYAIVLLTLSLLISPIKSAFANSLLDLVLAQRSQENALFNTFEYRYHSFKSLPSWSSVLNRSKPEFSTFLACANNKKKCKTSEQRAWHKFIISIRNKPRSQTIQAVNTHFNRWPYKTDNNVYGTDEYWATLGQFIKNSGDCEDYAIAKYYTLKALGFKENEIRIVALTNPTKEKGHVVLAIYGQGDIQILDNRSDLILSHKEFSNYSPLYSINQTTHWVHRPKVPDVMNPTSKMWRQALRDP